jgi:hypothetical protein
MQVKPRFETFKILQQYPFLKDDTGNDICLTLMEVKPQSHDDEIVETPYQYWCCIGKKQEQWNNKAISYESVAYWKAKSKENLFKGNVNGFDIEEVENGQHFMFDKNVCGLRTIFKLKRNTSTKDYDKLFKDIYNEDRIEGSTYPNLQNPEAVFINGAWLIIK